MNYGFSRTRARCMILYYYIFDTYFVCTRVDFLLLIIIIRHTLHLNLTLNPPWRTRGRESEGATALEWLVTRPTAF